MDALIKLPPLPAAAENPRDWLAAYLRHRARLASCESNFQCDPACARPGCKDRNLQIQVSVIDLLGAALHLNEPVASVYRRFYSLGLFIEERDDWLRLVAVKLKKPCPFLENDLCGIYPVRPLPCILFPEYLVWQGTFEAKAGAEHFRDYLCLQRPLQLSPARTEVMGELMRMWARESLVSSFFLFNHTPCRLDFANLAGDLLHAAAGPGEAVAAEKHEPGRTIPHPVLERFFHERLAGFPPFAEVGGKIDQLQTLEVQEQFLRLFQDDRLNKNLKRGTDDRAVVFRLVQGELRPQKRSLSSAASKCY